MTILEVRYFAYGSNLDADQMRERCPSSRAIGPVRLDDHRLAFTHFSRRWDGGAADVVPEPEAAVWGVLYALAADDLERLDRFEGGYERIRVRVAGPDAVHDALSYSAREKGLHVPRGLYLEKMLHWGARHGLPQEYLDALRRVPTLA